MNEKSPVSPRLTTVVPVEEQKGGEIFFFFFRINEVPLGEIFPKDVAELVGTLVRTTPICSVFTFYIDLQISYNSNEAALTKEEIN